MANLKDTSIKYINKDFGSFKRDLMRYAQAHFSGSYQDYNESSPGMMVLELQAYVADVLAYYMDQQFLEIKQSTARQMENIEDFAKMRGYKPKGLRSARVMLDFIIEVGSLSGTLAPDPDYTPVLLAGTQAQGPNGVIFETLEDIDFSKYEPDHIVYSRTDSRDYVAIRMKAEAIAAKTEVAAVTVDDFQPFKRIQLGQLDIQEVLSVYDSEGQQWYEVDYLAQNSVFDQTVNENEDAKEVPYVLKLRSTSRRYMVDRSVAANTTHLQFGNGDGMKFDDELIPNMADYALPIMGKPQFSTFVLDPQNFIKTKTMGLSPHNTVLTVKYRIGGGRHTNVPAHSVNKVQSALFVFKRTGLDATKTQAVRSSVEVINLSASEGGGDAETVSEIKANADAYFAAQARAVTREDFMTHILSMPAKFGRPEKAFIQDSKTSETTVDIHLLSLSPEGYFVPPTNTLKGNVETYLKKIRMLTDNINIFPGRVINFGINFGVVISPKFNRSEVLTTCLMELRNYFGRNKMQLGMPIVKSDVEATLQNINGVISVYKLEFRAKTGTGYSEVSDFNFDTAQNHGIYYCPSNAIFEIRYPELDIVGESK